MNTATATQNVEDLEGLNDFDPIFCETFEDLGKELAEVERDLGRRLEVRRNVRQILIALESANKLDEDELVVRWQALYSRYMAWAKLIALEAPVCAWEEPPCASEEIDRTEAAEQAASAVLWIHIYGARSQTEANLGALLSWFGHRTGKSWAWRICARTTEAARRESFEFDRHLGPRDLHAERSSLRPSAY